MKINFSPVCSDVRSDYDICVEGDILYIDGEELDFGPLPEGATLPRSAVQSKWLSSDVTRINGVIELTVTLPHAQNAPESRRFPESIIVSEDGYIELPPYDEEVPEEEVFDD